MRYCYPTTHQTCYMISLKVDTDVSLSPSLFYIYHCCVHAFLQRKWSATPYCLYCNGRGAVVSQTYSTIGVVSGVSPCLEDGIWKEPTLLFCRHAVPP